MNNVFFVNEKGGASKSTSLANLAITLPRIFEGGILEDMKIIDLDNSQLAQVYIKSLRDKGNYPYPSVIHDHKEAVKVLKSYDLVFIDTPSNLTKEIANFLNYADLIIIPVAPHSLEMNETEVFVTSIKETGIPYKILWTRTRKGDNTEDFEKKMGKDNFLTSHIRFSERYENFAEDGKMQIDRFFIDKVSGLYRIKNELENVGTEILEELELI